MITLHIGTLLARSYSKKYKSHNNSYFWLARALLVTDVQWATYRAERV